MLAAHRTGETRPIPHNVTVRRQSEALWRRFWALKLRKTVFTREVHMKQWLGVSELYQVDEFQLWVTGRRRRPGLRSMQRADGCRSYE